MERRLTTLRRLSDPTSRTAAAEELAREVGAESLVIYLKDREIDRLLPAPGFPQTWRGHPGVRGLLDRCTVPGLHRGGSQDLLGLVCDEGTTLLFFGGEPDPTAVIALGDWMPLVSATLVAQSMAGRADADVKVARAA